MRYRASIYLEIDAENECEAHAKASQTLEFLSVTDSTEIPDGVSTGYVGGVATMSELLAGKEI